MLVNLPLGDVSSSNLTFLFLLLCLQLFHYIFISCTVCFKGTVNAQKVMNNCNKKINSTE